VLGRTPFVYRLRVCVRASVVVCGDISAREHTEFHTRFIQSTRTFPDCTEPAAFLPGDIVSALPLCCQIALHRVCDPVTKYCQIEKTFHSTRHYWMSINSRRHSYCSNSAQCDGWDQSEQSEPSGQEAF